MSYETDPALYKSNFKLLEDDKYPTEHWVSRALAKVLQIPPRTSLWECAAGYGDIVDGFKYKEFTGYAWYASDTKPNREDINKEDFLTTSKPPADHIQAIITNPPYSNGLAEAFIRKSLKYLMDDSNNIKLVALLLRSEYIHSVNRMDLFNQESPFSMKIALCGRPKWDWRLDKKDRKKGGPRHNFSWYVWEKDAVGEFAHVLPVSRREVKDV